MKSGVIRYSFRDLVGRVLGVLMLLALAACGGGGGSPGKVSGTSGTGVGTVSLIFSSSELKSAGTAGSEVTVTALVRDGNNAAVADIPVTFSATSGTLAVSDAKSDKNGQAKATLSTAGDRTNRRITVTVLAGGKTASGTVDVVGTTIAVTGPSTVTAGGTGDLTITVKDSANVAVPNVPVSYSSANGNSITVKTSNGGSASAPLTNSSGQVVLTMGASTAGTDTILFSAQGATSSWKVNVNAAKLTVDVTGSGDPKTASTSTSCEKISATYTISGTPQNGTVNISTSRGRIYSDSACTAILASGSAAIANGISQNVYLKSDTAGYATITASIANGPSAQTSIEFVAQLTSSATISLQADPATIGTNSGSGQSEKSTLTAVVRDGTGFNNLVKGATVEFSLISDKSGGSLSNPSVVQTASNGSASVVFTAGTADTPQDGVAVQARIQGTSITAVTYLTVAKKSLFIAAGTGNKLGTPSDTTYQMDYTVFVTDAAGNPVPNAMIVANVVPTQYGKGSYVWDATGKIWTPNYVDVCANEDTIPQDGILNPDEDFNQNGRLDPGIPLNVSSSGTTDVQGIAKISILYPRDRGNWTEVKLTIKGSVSGTESTYQPPIFWLPVLSDDLTNEKSAPPSSNGNSPYGINVCRIAN